MRYLSSQDLADLLSPAQVIGTIEHGLGDYAARKAIVPIRQHTDFGESTLLTMPAIGNKVFGTKVVSVVPSNASRNLPVIHGLMILSDKSTGVPLVVMDAAMLTAQRTGAIGALAVKYTTPPEMDCLGIIGTGVQATWQVIFACAVRNISTVFFVGRSDGNAQRFTERLSRYLPRVRVIRCQHAAELLRSTPAVICATTASDPVLPSEQSALEGKHFISIGSFKPSMRELPSLVYQLAGDVVVDSEAAKTEVGDLIDPIASGVLREDRIFHIADLVVGKKSIDTTGTTAFKSVGMALYDLYAAHAFVAEAERVDRGTSLSS
jgi:ornithine cyclodeaminase